MEELQLTTTDNVITESIEADTEESVEQSNLKISQRERKPKTYFGDPLLYKTISEALSEIKNPLTVMEAIESPHVKMWKEAMQEELNNLQSKQT